MHQLVPEFILENLRQDRRQGSLTAAALFIDISGFTEMTEALMAHGQYGAEILAGIMRTVFTPLVHSVFAQGGFVTGYAGDALTAVFPQAAAQAQPALRALAAVTRMQEHMAANARQVTRFGVFPLTAKAGLALGRTDWGILTDDDERRATYYFRGAPIDASAAAEHLGEAGQIIADASIYQALAGHVSGEPQQKGFWRITDVQDGLPEMQAVDPPSPDVALQERFFPHGLAEMDIEGEFRQVLNLFVGLQGAPTHEELAAFMQGFFRLQEQYEGLLNRVDFGDKGCGLLMFWGAPVSFENDLARALGFILALREASHIPLRAGLTYRIAHAGFIGSALAEEYTCYGRGVNLAARQMTSAGWGEIWLDEEVARRAKADFRLEALGERRFKGFAAAQPVYLFLGRRERASLLEERPFFGRDAELRALHEAVAPLFAGQFAGTMTILGEAGIGKSRLVHAFLDPLVEQRRVTVFLCQTDEILRQSLNPFRYFLHFYFDQSPAHDEAENKRRFDEQLRVLLERVPDAELREELQRTASFLGSMVGLRWPDSLYEQLDPELRYENTLNALKALFKAESLRRPLIIEIEDAHWLDQDSLAFLARLTRNVAGYPFAVLLTSREPLPEEAFDAEAPQQALQILALDEQVVTELAESILAHTPSAALVRLLLQRTEGNPFFVEQVLLYLQENDLLAAAEASSGHALGEDVYIPADVRAVLIARIDRLSPVVKEMVQKAAVLGREFEAPILAHMMDQDPSLEPLLATAVEESVWYALDQVRYLFRHALLRDAAYDMQLQARRRRLHQLAASAFEAEAQTAAARPLRHATVAYHYDQAEISDKARLHYGVAAGQAQAEYRNEDAITYYTRALDLATEDDLAGQIALLNGRETVYQWLGRRQEQQQDLAHLQTLLAGQPDDVRLSDLALRQSAYGVVTGDYQTATHMAEQALRYALAAGDTLAEARAYHRWGRVLWQQGDAALATEKLERALALARAEADLALEADCLSDLATAERLLADYPRAQGYLEQATFSYEAVDDEQGQVRAYNLFGVIEYDLGRYAESEQYYLRALDLCHEIGWRYAEARILLNLGNTQFDLGDYEKSQRYLAQAAALGQEIGDPYLQANGLDTLGLVAHYTGDLVEAVTLYGQALDMQRAIGNVREMAFVLTHLGFAQLATGELAAAERYLREALALREGLDARALQMDTLAGLAAVRLAQGQVDGAQEYTAVILDYIAANGTEGIELPTLVYLTLYQVLQAAAAAGQVPAAEAQRVLNDGYMLLAGRVRRLHDEEMRARYVERVPYNRALRDLWLAARA